MEGIITTSTEVLCKFIMLFAYERGQTVVQLFSIMVNLSNDVIG